MSYQIKFWFSEIFSDTYLDDLGVFCPKIQYGSEFYVKVHETCLCAKNEKYKECFWVHVTNNLE